MPDFKRETSPSRTSQTFWSAFLGVIIILPLSIMAHTIVESVTGLICCAIILWLLQMALRKFYFQKNRSKMIVPNLLLYSMFYMAHIVTIVFFSDRLAVVLSLLYTARTSFYLLLIWQTYSYTSRPQMSEFNVTKQLAALAAICVIMLAGFIICSVLLDDDFQWISIIMYPIYDILIMILCYLAYTKPMQYNFENSAGQWNYGVDTITVNEETFKRVNAMQFFMHKLAVIQITTSVVASLSLVSCYLSTKRDIIGVEYGPPLLRSLAIIGDSIQCLFILFLFSPWRFTYFKLCGVCHLSMSCFIYDRRDIISYMNSLSKGNRRTQRENAGSQSEN